MKDLSWDDYYERFYDWAPATQKSRSYNLTGYGPADEVFEIALEFAYDDEKFATRFIRKAMDAGVHFTPEQVLEFSLYADKATLGRMALGASPSFTEDQMEEIYIVAARARWQTARSTRQKIRMNKKREGRPLYSRPPFAFFIR